jgi:hypothetical protein
MKQDDKKKGPPPGSSFYNDREPEQEPNTDPRTGQPQPDIQDERSKSKRGNKPLQKDGKFPEETPGDDPREYNDGEPVEEKSPKLPNAL